MSVFAILLCGGRGQRLGLEAGKALAPLAGRPLFAWSLDTLQTCDVVDGIVVVGPREALQAELARCGLSSQRVVGWPEGGPRRQDSVARGLEALPEECTMVVVHDCARALASRALVARVVADALAYGAAIAAVPVTDTLKRGRLEFVEDTVPRAELWSAQTPQVFRRDWLVAAHRQARREATDDAALVESLGHRVRLTPGETFNCKITTLEDLELAEAWLTRGSVRR